MPAISEYPPVSSEEKEDSLSASSFTAVFLLPGVTVYNLTTQWFSKAAASCEVLVQNDAPLKPTGLLLFNGHIELLFSI